MRPNATIRLDFLHTDESFEGEEVSTSMASCLPESYINESRLRIDFYRKIASILEIIGIQELREELQDRLANS